GRHRPDLAHTHLRHHAGESRPRDEPRGGPAQVVIHDIDLTPPELLQSILHRILQPLAFEVVVHLMDRRLPHIHNGFPCQMLRLDFVTHRAPPASTRRRRRRRARAAAAPATGSSSLGSRKAASETTDARRGDETTRVARVSVGSRTGASAPPATGKERCCASSTSPGSERAVVRSNVCNALKASQLTAGTAITRSRPHAAGSNIHVGTSSDKRCRSSSRPHRLTECPCLTSTS